MAPRPSISVVIPTRDCRELVLQAVRSVQRQTLAAWEAIVVDDRSHDDTLTALRELARSDPRVRVLLRQGELGGAPVCRNQGRAAAGGDLVVFLDADDLLAPQALRSRVEFLAHRTDCDAAISLCRMFREVPGDTRRLFNAPTSDDELDRFLRFDNPWGTLCATWRREALERVGAWDESLPSWQDWDFHVRALTAGVRIAWTGDEPDCLCRQARAAAIGASSAAPDHLRSHELLLRRTMLRLREAGLWTAQRRQQLHGIHLWLAETWAERGDIGRALAIWRAGSKDLRLPCGVYVLGLVRIHAIRHSRLRRLSHRLTHFVWPDRMFPWRSRTYLR